MLSPARTLQLLCVNKDISSLLRNLLQMGLPISLIFVNRLFRYCKNLHVSAKNHSEIAS
jgi:hypothetical protein